MSLQIQDFQYVISNSFEKSHTVKEIKRAAKLTGIEPWSPLQKISSDKTFDQWCALFNVQEENEQNEKEPKEQKS